MSLRETVTVLPFRSPLAGGRGENRINRRHDHACRATWLIVAGVVLPERPCTWIRTNSRPRVDLEQTPRSSPNGSPPAGAGPPWASLAIIGFLLGLRRRGGRPVTGLRYSVRDPRGELALHPSRHHADERNTYGHRTDECRAGRPAPSRSRNQPFPPGSAFGFAATLIFLWASINSLQSNLVLDRPGPDTTASDFQLSRCLT